MAAAAAAALLLWPTPALTVSRVPDGRLLWQVPVHPGSRIALVYTNSLYNAPTTEQFAVASGRLRLDEVSSTREAVLNYLALDPPYQRRGDRFVAKRPGPVLAELTIRIGQTGQQRLVVDGRELPLYRAGTGEAVRVRITWLPRIAAVLHGGANP